MGDDRRAFLKTVGGVSAVLAAPTTAVDAGAEGLAAERTAAAAAAAGSRYLLELEGVVSGFMKSFEGGTVKAEVVSLAAPGELVVRKRLGRLRNEAVTVQADLGALVGTPLLNWVAATLSHDLGRREGLVRTADLNLIEKRVNSFQGALISEISFPKLDATSRDPATLTLTIAPEAVEYSPGSGQPLPATVPKAKAIQASNFRLTIDGLEEACARVSKVEALTVQRKVTDVFEGGECAPALLLPGPLDVGDLVATFDESKSAQVYAWYQEFIIDGVCGEGRERRGRLELLAPNLQTVLLTINFFGLGIYALAPAASSASESVARVTAKMYCEEISIVTAA